MGYLVESDGTEGYGRKVTIQRQTRSGFVWGNTLKPEIATRLSQSSQFRLPTEEILEILNRFNSSITI